VGLLPDGEKNHDDSFLRFDTIPARDRRTGRQTYRHVAITRASVEPVFVMYA